MPEPHVSGPEMRKTDLKRRVRDEVARFSAIVLYLWVMFGTFALHESVVSQKDPRE
jgi:hypothetical protein